MTNNKTLRDTNDFLNSITVKNKNKPLSIEVVYHILAKEYNITLDKICELPVPYLLSLLKVYSYIKEDEERELKKSRRK